MKPKTSCSHSGQNEKRREYTLCFRCLGSFNIYAELDGEKGASVIIRHWSLLSKRCKYLSAKTDFESLFLLLPQITASG